MKVIFLIVLGVKFQLKWMDSGECGRKQNEKYDHRPLSIQRIFHTMLTKTGYILWKYGNGKLF